jgi:hypothetical protein
MVNQVQAAITVKRIRFTPEPAAGENVRRRFTEPRPMAAVEETSALSKLPTDQPWPEPSDGLVVIVAPTRLPFNLEPMVESWLSPPDRDAPRPTVVRLESGTVRWRPGRAVLEHNQAESAAPGIESLLDALAGFAFLEGELRRLEQALLPYEASAPADAALAYRIRQSSHAEWDRFGRTMEALSVLRLTFARLEPLLGAPARSLDPEGRRAVSALTARSGVRARLESFSNRLEACEDLYEGAVDRISDFRWYRNGEILEIAIVALLVLEVILLVCQMLR